MSVNPLVVFPPPVAGSGFEFAGSPSAGLLFRFPDGPVQIRPSVDWLTVRQSHPEAPEFGGNRVLELDELGESRWHLLKRAPLEGSYSSKVQVRSFRGVVEVSFNPSRWNRRHSVAGCCRSVADAVAVANRVLSDHPTVKPLGLPLFVSPPTVRRLRAVTAGVGDSVGEVELGRVDVCCTYSCGSEAAAVQFMRMASQVIRHGKRAVCFGGDETVAWGGRSSPYVKFYRKADELERHARASKQAVELSDLIRALRDAGAVRHEVSLKRRDLKLRRLDTERAWRSVDLPEFLRGFWYVDKIGTCRLSLAELQAQFIALGDSPRKALRLKKLVESYFGGFDILEGLSVSQRFRIRADLRRVGVDPLNPPELDKLPVELESVNVTPLFVSRELLRR